jgi:hypothetical protein
LLKGKFGAADFAVRSGSRLDREHHFHVISGDDSKKSSSVRDQTQRNDLWTRECVKEAVNVWRVHYKVAFAPSIVLNAILLRARCKTVEASAEDSRGF